MTIGIEASRANRVQKTGVEWYALNVIEELKKIDATNEWFLYTNEALQGVLAALPAHWHESRLVWTPKYLWTQLRLSYEMWRRPSDVLFVPAHVLPLVAPKQNVVTIHDVGFRRVPELYPLKQRLYHEWTTRDIVHRCPRIVTVSEFSKREIVELYGADPNKITVAPLAVADSVREAASEEVNALRQRLALPKRFILFIGRIEEKKNVSVLIEALALYRQQTNDLELQLVLAGREGFGIETLRARIIELGLTDSVKFTGYLDEADKSALLTAAETYVQPSWYEGFGIPVLEAMRCGAPVIAANSSAMPEVAGEGNALFFNPASASDLAGRLVELASPEKRQQFIANGKAREAQFSWRKTAEIILPLLTNW
ncbi:MAG: glycosyltransferase family 1 protein [Patescibacteria group bacterium]